MSSVNRKVRCLVTGADGFLGRNLCQRLEELSGVDIRRFTRRNDWAELSGLLEDVDYVFHLAGVNRPIRPSEFEKDNAEFTEHLAAALAQAIGKGGHAPVVAYTSSTQVTRDNPYGSSKRQGELALLRLKEGKGVHLAIMRLPNVFGKWCRPEYNSVVATFCHNIARELTIRIDDPSAVLRLVYIDDVIDRFVRMIEERPVGDAFIEVTPQYELTVGELADTLREFHNGRSRLEVSEVGTGLRRALYSTYVSYLPPERFKYAVPRHSDARGEFVEMLKTPRSGQISYFTAKPGITRGGHYHHSKTEKFLVIQGIARYRFRHVITDEFHDVTVNAAEGSQIVETIPGWVHDITNVGDDLLVVLLWANEVFDRDRPDTFSRTVVAS